ncbi:MAG: beta-CASP ribonuclease aCPSF1 [Candidatus Nezhaarchaeota archaeon]|nr:beta-CASP ribonuclease aCPSF1 [Candidatus Nezhaarchaeota archaeon]
MHKSSSPPSVKEELLQLIPKEAKVTKIEFEGPEVVVYAQNPTALIEDDSLMKNLAKTLKKRVVLKTDPEVRLSEEEARKIIVELAPPEAELTDITFDKVMGEVIIEARRPGLVIGKGGSLLRQILMRTYWRPVVHRAPPLYSRIARQVARFIYKNSRYRQKVLREIGLRIHRPALIKEGEVVVEALGGFQEVGRSALLVRAGETNILIDCGVKPSASSLLEEFPALWLLDVDRLDAVIITHSHLDHCGALPYLFKYGYRGPVYCSRPTQMLMSLILLDYLDVALKEGRAPPYDLKDVKTALLHTIPLSYGEVTDIAPNVRLTLHNAGHIMGSSMVHLHIGDGMHNIVYTGDFKFAKTRLLEASASTFPRLETLIMESTYGAAGDIMPARQQTEEFFTQAVNRALARGGKVLIPVLSVGRAQEIMLVLIEAISQNLIPSIPIYIEGMVQEATAIHTIYPEELAREVKQKILYEEKNPFLSENFITVRSRRARPDIVEGEPCIIMATSGMLNAGPAVEYFKLLAPDEHNSLIFVSYQAEGTLGRRVQSGVKEVTLSGSNGKPEAVQVKCEVVSVEGFSGHSDRKQLLRFVQQVYPRPSKVLVCHGEPSKSTSLASAIQYHFRIPAAAPMPLEAVRLR